MTARPTAAVGKFPYPHRTIAQVDAEQLTHGLHDVAVQASAQHRREHLHPTPEQRTRAKGLPA